MITINITDTQYQDLLLRMEEIKSELMQKQKKSEDVFLDNQQFLQMMNISKRTAQTWRDDGVIAYSQVGYKLYYRMSDIQKLLVDNYKKAVK